MAAISNPFARLRASLTPLVPDEPAPAPFAPSDLAGLDQGAQLPSFPVPKVKGLFNPKTASPEELAEYPVVSRLRGDIAKDMSPWGTPENHPGFWGKLGHALSVASGGPDRREFQEMGLQKSLRELLGEQAKNEYQEAETGAIPSRENLEGAQANEANARANALEHPTPKEQTDKWKPMLGGNGQVMTAPDGSIVEVSDDGALRLQPLPSGAKIAPKDVPPLHDAFHEWLSDPTKYEAFMKEMAALKPSEKGAYGSLGPQFAAYHMLQTAYRDNPALLPLIAPMIANVMGNPANAAVFAKVPEGQPENEQGIPIGLSMPEAPTGATRTRGQFAGELLPTMEHAKSEVKALGNKLGPFAGRYSELVTGRIGAFGPEFNGLQTDMHNISTGWGRAHGNSEKVMEAFRQDLDSSKDPANLIEKLKHYAQQAKIYKAAGEGRPAKAEPETPQYKVGQKVNLNGKEVTIKKLYSDGTFDY